jgi:hypothetical protein
MPLVQEFRAGHVLVCIRGAQRLAQDTSNTSLLKLSTSSVTSIEVDPVMDEADELMRRRVQISLSKRRAAASAGRSTQTGSQGRQVPEQQRVQPTQPQLAQQQQQQQPRQQQGQRGDAAAPPLRYKTMGAQQEQEQGRSLQTVAQARQQPRQADSDMPTQQYGVPSQPTQHAAQPVQQQGKQPVQQQSKQPALAQQGARQQLSQRCHNVPGNPLISQQVSAVQETQGSLSTQRYDAFVPESQ